MVYFLPTYAPIFTIGSFLVLGGPRPVEGMTRTDIGRSSNDILQAVTHISQCLSELNTSVQSFNGTFDEAVGVYNDFCKMVSSLEQGTTDVKSTPAPISDADASTIMSAASSFQPNLQSILGIAVDKKDMLRSLNVSNVFSMMRTGITKFNLTTCVFGDALIGTFSDAMKPPAIDVRNDIIRQFNFAAEKYAEQVLNV